MRIPPKAVYRVIRSTAPFLFASVSIQAVLGILNKREYGGHLIHTLHSSYVPMVMLALVFSHTTFGFLSMVSRSKYRESPRAQIIVILSMVIAFIVLVVLLAV